VGLEGYERITPTVELINLAGHASQYSYAKSSQNVTGGEISQTVMLKLRKSLSGLKKEAPDLKRKVRELHIDVKEDKSYKINENISLNVSDNFKEVREQIRNITILAQGKVTPIFRCLKGLRQGSI